MASAKFPAIRIIAFALRGIAILDVAATVFLIVSVKSLVQAKQLADQQTFITVATIVFGYSLIIALVLFAIAELLICFTAIEENTRQGKAAVINLQSVVRTAIEEQTQKLEQKLASQAATQTAGQGTCPACGARFRVPDNMRTQQAACPKCGAKITI